MSVRLRELIKVIRQSKTAAEERAVISKECANIRTAFKNDDPQHRRRNIAKLLFIHMLGYPTQFGQMECLKLIVSNKFTDKRMGYLGLMLLLDEKQEVLMLVTNSLQNDLRLGNQYVVGLALCSLANISSSSIARDLSNEVIGLLSNTNPYIRKKAGLCAIRIIRKVPELMEQFIPKVRPLLAERNHGVLITAVSLIIEMCLLDQENIIYFRKAVSPLVKLLKGLILSGYAPEHDVNGITDPFLQVKILRLLRLLGKGDSAASDSMNDVLAQVATNTEASRNVGNAILYECVQTIMSIESEGGLRVLAINILGRFLMNKDNNIRYVALTTLQRVVDRDQQAVQRHRTTVLDCLKDPDISIRKKALDLTYALVNHSNIKLMVKELIQFLRTADLEFREDITAKICLLTYKFAPTPKWHVDTIFKVMNMAGHYVQDDVVATTIHLINRTSEIHSYVVHKLFALLTNDFLKQPLTQTAVWTIGEYGDLLLSGKIENFDPKTIIDLFDRIVRHPASSLQTRFYILTAVVKLHDRLNNAPGVHAAILQEFSTFRSNLNLELQQRACEYFSLLSTVSEAKLAEVLEHVPPLEIAEEEQPNLSQQGSAKEVSETSPAAVENLLGGTVAPILNNLPSGGSGSGSGDLLSLLSTPSTPSSGGGSLLDLLSSPAPAATTGLPALGMNAGAPSPSPSSGSLLDILGSTLAPASPLLGVPASASPTQQPTVASLSIPPVIVYSKNGINIKFDFVKNPASPNMTLINALISNSTPVQLSNFSMQAAVPPYMQIQLATPSSNILQPGTGTITQQIKLANNQMGQKPSAIRVKIEFVANGNQYSDDAVISNLPPGV